MKIDVTRLIMLQLYMSRIIPINSNYGNSIITRKLRNYGDSIINSCHCHVVNDISIFFLDSIFLKIFFFVLTI